VEQVDTRFYLDPEQGERFEVLQATLSEIESGDAPGVRQWSSAFDRLLKSGELEIIIGEILAKMSNPDSFQPSWISERVEEWLIAESSRFSLRAIVAKPQRGDRQGFISSLTQDVLVGNLGKMPVHFVRHTFPAGTHREVFQRGLTLEQREVGSIAHLESTCFEAAHDVAEYTISAPTLVVQLSPKSFAPLVWVFDKTTKAAVMCTASYDAPVRNQVVAELLQHLAMEPAGPAQPSMDILLRLVSNRHHYVRWRALQSLCAVDFEVAKPYLLNACDDTHPTVAHAARQAAQQLSLV
jgi:hypothetical protein